MFTHIFLTFVINICVNITTIIKFYLFISKRRKVLTDHITIWLCLTLWSNWKDAGMLVSRKYKNSKIQLKKEEAQIWEICTLIQVSFSLAWLRSMTKEEIDSFLSFFPQLPRILNLARQAAIEEKRRRKFEVEIAKFRRERRMKYKRFIEGKEKKAS